jgi:hypothetical protein
VYLKGTHWLVAYPGSWKLTLADGLTVQGRSAAKRQDVAVARLKGEKLEGIVINARSGATTFHFDLGAKLEIRLPQRSDAEPEELWAVHVPRRRAVALFSRGKFWIGSTRAAAEPVKPLARASSDTEEVVIGRVPSASSRAARTSQGRRRVAAV